MPHRPFEAAARRELTVHGAPVELVWLPERAARRGIPTPDQPPFRPNLVDRILCEETVWRSDGVALTGNRYPFARDQIVLWSEAPAREAPLRLLQIALLLEERTGGTVLLNTIGAAASIPRAHVHLVGERLPFLVELPRAPARGEWLPAVAGVDLQTLATPFPCLAVGVRGPAADRAAAVHHLLEVRAAPAVNLVSSGGTTWMFLRSAVETPAPWFPHALGAAEFWGRWCYADRSAYERATSADLEEALRTSGWPA